MLTVTGAHNPDWGLGRLCTAAPVGAPPHPPHQHGERWLDGHVPFEEAAVSVAVEDLLCTLNHGDARRACATAWH